MTGTILNFATILLGGLIGLLAGNRIPPKVRQTLTSALGLFTLAYGIHIFAQTQNILVPLSSIVLGVIAGEALRIEELLNGLAERIQQKVESGANAGSPNAQRFISGFVAASLLFVVGPMAILGSIQDGLVGDYQMLAIKSLLDGIASIAFASTFGVGVLFSAPIVLVYQGAISLLAGTIGKGFDQSVILEMTSVGGVILAGIAISNLLEIKKIRIGSFLPALLFVVLIVLLLNGLGIAWS
jgi:uncharacterized membrane protein YqgA involved in biofilm formation